EITSTCLLTPPNFNPNRSRLSKRAPPIAISAAAATHNASVFWRERVLSLSGSANRIPLTRANSSRFCAAERVRNEASARLSASSVLRAPSTVVDGASWESTIKLTFHDESREPPPSHRRNPDPTGQPGSRKSRFNGKHGKRTDAGKQRK